MVAWGQESGRGLTGKRQKKLFWWWNYPTSWLWVYISSIKTSKHLSKKKKHRGWIYLISLPFCKILQLSIQLKKEILSILSKLLPLKMFKAHSNSNYIVDDLNMGHPTQQIKTLLCNLPLEETRTACTNISTRSTSLREDSTHL